MSQDTAEAITQPVLEALRQLMNVGAEVSARRLKKLLHSDIELSVPQVNLGNTSNNGFLTELAPSTTLSVVQLRFEGGLRGVSELILPTRSVASIAALMGESYPAVGVEDPLLMGMATEIGNIVINGLMGSVANLVDVPLEYSPPVYFESRMDELPQSLTAKSSSVVGYTTFTAAKHEVKGVISMIFEKETEESLSEHLRIWLDTKGPEDSI